MRPRAGWLSSLSGVIAKPGLASQYPGAAHDPVVGLPGQRRAVVCDKTIGELAQPHQNPTGKPISKQQTALAAAHPLYFAKNLEIQKAQESRTAATGEFSNSYPGPAGRKIIEKTFAVPGCQDQAARNSEPQPRI